MGFELLVILPTIGGLIYLLTTQESVRIAESLLWAAVVAAVELLPVPVWRGMQMSMAFPLLLAVAFLFTPAEAAAVALVGSFDLRELKRTIPPTLALFNRCQVALSIAAASAVFGSLGSVQSSVATIVGAAIVACAADYLVNTSLVATGGYFLYGLRPTEMMRKLRIGRPKEFLLSYLGLGMLGVIMALLHQRVGFWSVATFLAPLVFARQMFFRSRALEEAHVELKEREQVLRALSNRMAEERQDERTHIAAYLHDDLAQLIFRLSLQVDIARNHLLKGDLDATEGDLESIRDTKNRTNDKIRALIRDLHRSPLGRAGLPEAIDSFIEEVGQSAGVRFHLDVADLPLPPPIQLLAYHIAREAVMNSLKHAEPENVWVSLTQSADSIDLVIRDDGTGFDAEAPGPEGHFGMAMMRERAQVAGGSFAVDSSRGEGASIRVRFSTSWLQEGEPAVELPTPSTEATDAAPESVPA